MLKDYSAIVSNLASAELLLRLATDIISLSYSYKTRVEKLLPINRQAILRNVHSASHFPTADL